MSLAQYYTTDNFSNLLISHLQSGSVSKILDIGCGQAGLLNAASKRWSKAKLIGYDIDPSNYSINSTKLNVQYGNGLDPDLSNKILNTFGNVDVSVSNPPFLNVDYNSNVKTILKKSGLHDAISSRLKVIPVEIVFIAQNLMVIKDGGELGIILPASLVNGERWKGLRDYLLSNYSISNSIQFPTNAFKKTEASTFAIYLRKKEDKHLNDIILRDHQLEQSIYIKKVDAIHRMDFSYYQFKSKDKIPDKTSSISNLFRGNKTEKSLRTSGNRYLHTSDLKDYFQTLNVRKDFSTTGVKFAKKGDLIVSRVGSRCVGKCAYIKSGKISISDCLFVIQSEEMKSLIQYVKSGDFYKKARHSALGVGAKYITMSLLQEIINDSKI